MEYDDPLRQHARHAIETGRLPAVRPARTWAGKGTGASCLLCALAISADDVELELEFIETTTASRCCRVHSQCFTAWDLECRRRATGS